METNGEYVADPFDPEELPNQRLSPFLKLLLMIHFKMLLHTPDWSLMFCSALVPKKRENSLQMSQKWDVNRPTKHSFVVW